MSFFGCAKKNQQEPPPKKREEENDVLTEDNDKEVLPVDNEKKTLPRLRGVAVNKEEIHEGPYDLSRCVSRARWRGDRSALIFVTWPPRDQKCSRAVARGILG